MKVARVILGAGVAGAALALFSPTAAARVVAYPPQMGTPIARMPCTAARLETLPDMAINVLGTQAEGATRGKVAWLSAALQATALKEAQSYAFHSTTFHISVKALKVGQPRVIRGHGSVSFEAILKLRQARGSWSQTTNATESGTLAASCSSESGWVVEALPWVP